MKEQLKKFLSAGYELSDAWDNDKAKNYPVYLPSFDEFLCDLERLLENFE